MIEGVIVSKCQHCHKRSAYFIPRNDDDTRTTTVSQGVYWTVLEGVFMKLLIDASEK